jgi:hypothetical protein
MHVSMPHCELVEQGFALPTTWQLPARQYSPMWQSAFAEQPSEQWPFTQALPPAQSFAEGRDGTPLLTFTPGAFGLPVFDEAAGQREDRQDQ